MQYMECPNCDSDITELVMTTAIGEGIGAGTISIFLDCWSCEKSLTAVLSLSVHLSFTEEKE